MQSSWDQRLNPLIWFYSDNNTIDYLFTKQNFFTGATFKISITIHPFIAIQDLLEIILIYFDLGLLGTKTYVWMNSLFLTGSYWNIYQIFMYEWECSIQTTVAWYH